MPIWRRVRPIVEPSGRGRPGRRPKPVVVPSYVTDVAPDDRASRQRLKDRGSPIRPIEQAEFEAMAERYPYYRGRWAYTSVATAIAADLIDRLGLSTAIELGPHLRPIIVGGDVMDRHAQPDLQAE